MYLIKTQTARERFEIEKEQMLTRRLDARILGESEAVVDDTIARGVLGSSKPALPKGQLLVCVCQPPVVRHLFTQATSARCLTPY